MHTQEKEVLFSRASSPAIAVSDEINSQSRTNASLLVNRLTSQGYKSVADCIGKDVSTVSKWVSSGEFDRIGLVVALLGLKIVPKDWDTVDLAQVAALVTLSQAHVASLTVADLVRRVPA